MADRSLSGQLASRASLLERAAARATAYLEGLDARAVAPTPEALARLQEFDTPLPAEGLGEAEVLAMLDEIGGPATVASAGPRFFGFVTGGALPVAVAASWLSAAWDQNAALNVMSPLAATLDLVAQRWIVELLGLPSGTAGGFVTGASMANATCLATARDTVLSEHGWDALEQGLVGAPPIEVVVGDEAHATIAKSLGLVGLGRGRARRLPTDDQGRVVARDLPTLTKPAIVCLQAGNVNSGASDPFNPLIDWAREQGAWVHVDGAFGLWAAACPSLASQVEGVERADSWACDAHKWLNATYDCGLALVARPEALARSMRTLAAYLPSSSEHDPCAHTPQTSQRARGVEVWAILAALGADGVAELVGRTCAHARRFAEALSKEGFRVLNDVVLNQVVVDFGGEDANAAVIGKIQADGTCWCGPTRWRGRSAMRISVSSWATTEADVEASIAAMVRLARESSA